MVGKIIGNYLQDEQSDQGSLDKYEQCDQGYESKLFGPR